MTHALTLGSTLPPDDPGRLVRRSTAGSYALAVAVVAAVGVWATVHPQPDWSGDEVLVVADTGAVLVNRDGVLHPALNLTSALLAREQPGTSTRTVSAAALTDAPRGEPQGIVGAPAELPAPDALVSAGWSLCDDDREAAAGDGGTVTTAVIGTAAPGRTLTGDDAVLVTAAAGADRTWFLLWAGRRIPVDPDDRALLEALGLADTRPRPVSAALLTALPLAAVPAVTTPAGSGLSSALEVRDRSGQTVPVGAVLRAVRADGRATLHLLHDHGLEAVTPVLADLLTARTGQRVVTVDPQAVLGLPDSDERAVATVDLPPTAPVLVTDPIVCASWSADPDGWTLTAATTLGGPPPHEVSSAGVDQVQLPAGHGAVVHVDDGTVDGHAVLITDQGVAHRIEADVPERLGLLAVGAVPPPAPTAVIARLPPGPPLSVEAARAPWRFSAGDGQWTVPGTAGP